MVFDCLFLWVLPIKGFFFFKSCFYITYSPHIFSFMNMYYFELIVLWAIWSPFLPILANKVLLEHSHANMITNCQWLFHTDGKS